MEIFARSIAYSANETEVTRQIAKALHGPLFASAGPPTNFKLSLHRSKRSGSGTHAGTGSLTLPSRVLGEHFLREFGPLSPSSLIVANRRVEFSPSKNEPRPHILEELTRVPYQDPEQLRQREERQASLATSVNVKAIQFGWMCRDNVFSIEWEMPAHTQPTYSIPGAPPFLAAALKFDDDERELRISQLSGQNIHYIVLRYAQVSMVEFDHSASSVIMALHSAPAFEVADYYQTIANSMTFGRKVKTRFRKASFGGEEHTRKAPFISVALRLVLVERRDLTNFDRMRAISKLPNPYQSYNPPEHRNLFSTANMDRLENWIDQLEWQLAFQCAHIYNALLVDPKEFWALRPRIEALRGEVGVTQACDVLKHFAVRLQNLFWDEEDERISGSFENVNKCFEETVQEAGRRSTSLRLKATEGVFECLKVTFTPTAMHLSGPLPDQSNRVLRQFPNHHEHFIRVNFTDEDNLHFRWNFEVDGVAFVHDRIKGILRDGFWLAGRHFEFLAYSSSALKEHSVWFLTPFDHPEKGRVTAHTIRGSLGNFSKVIRCPARYGARISQAFSATDPSIVIGAEEIIPINDIERNGSLFTDGIGTISREAADEIANALDNLRKGKYSRRSKSTPSAYQIRLGGYKGMLSVDYKLEGAVICVRPSMDKFDAPDSLDVEVARAFRTPGSMYLNRPLIMILDTLGVDHQAFMKLQDAAVKEANNAIKSLGKSARLLEMHGLGTAFRVPSVLLSLQRNGMELAPKGFIKDEFLNLALDHAVQHVLRELKYRARIPVPDSWTLVGVADEHNYLKEGEVFACIRNHDSKTLYLKGPVLISRSPSLHPGDVQMVRAIGKPPANSPFEIEELPNCVVFSCQGNRSLASCLGGGDLDGDLYNLIMMPELHPSTCYEPAGYEAAERKILDRDCTINDVVEFVADFITSDVVGLVATHHLVLADQSPLGVCDPDCIRLAKLHSDAVDFPKSGKPVPANAMPPLKLKMKPDWAAPELASDKTKFYPSTRAVGKLYRAIKLRADTVVKRKAREQRESYDVLEQELNRMTIGRRAVPRARDELARKIRRLLGRYEVDVDYWPDGITPEIMSTFHAFADELQCICVNNTVSYSRTAQLTEEEVFIGTIVAKSSQPRRRRDVMAAMRGQATELVSRVRAELEGEESDSLEDWLTRAWVAWEVSCEMDESFGARSFGWVALGAMFDAIREIEEERRVFG